MNDATRILAEFKTALDKHFALSPVKPEHRLSDETAARFAEMVKQDETTMTLEQRVARLEKVLGLNG